MNGGGPLAKADDGLLEALWQPRALIWMLILVLGLALALVLAPGQPELPLAARAAQFGSIALVGLWVAVLVIAVLYALRRPLGAVDASRLAWITFVLLLLVTAAVSALAWVIAHDMSGTPLLEMMTRSMALAAILGLLSLGAFQGLWRNRLLLQRAQHSELAALQARMRPHFLFNTLNAAIALVRQRPERVETLLLDLSDLLRAAIAGPQVWELQSELELTRKYLDIESLRFGQRLTVRWSLPEPLPSLRLPMLSLQPLVENAVLHGIERRPPGGHLGIELREDDEQFILVVRNELAADDVPRRIGHKLGVDAVRERVRQFTGGRGSLQLRQADGHFEAVLALPRDQPATTS